MKITITITKDDEQPAQFLKDAKDVWDMARNLKETQHTVECHVNLYGTVLRYDQNSDPTENAFIYERQQAQAACSSCGH